MLSVQCSQISVIALKSNLDPRPRLGLIKRERRSVSISSSTAHVLSFQSPFFSGPPPVFPSSARTSLDRALLVSFSREKSTKWKNDEGEQSESRAGSLSSDTALDFVYRLSAESDARFGS